MSLPLDWLVLFFFIILAAVFFLVYEINSKFKWRERAFELENEVQKLRNRISSSPSILLELNEVMKDIKKDLTNRQFQIFIYTIEGLSSKEIAEILNIAPTSIDSHIKEIVKKQNVKKRPQLAGVFFEKLKTKIGVESLSDL
jgi:DNA-binding CsgD family transcriptional regulator